MFGSLIDLINFLYIQKMDGDVIDDYFCAAETENEIDLPIVRIPMGSTDQLIHMCKRADHVIFVPTAGIVFVGALYTNTSSFPVSRCYFQQEPSLLAFAGLGRKLTQMQIKTTTLRDEEELKNLIHENGWKKRISEYKARRAANKPDYEMLRSGREKNTTLGNAFFINTAGCFICSEPAIGIASMTLAEMNGPSSMFAVRLCQNHQDEREKSDTPLAEYLAKKFDIRFRMGVQERSREEILDDAEVIMTSKLDLKISNRSEYTIRAERQSGLVLIYRHKHGKNYAYNIDGPMSKKLVRVDSANHHPVPVGPDHIHLDLQKKLPPESSYTTGDFVLDWPLIARVMEELESRIGPDGRIQSKRADAQKRVAMAEG